MNVRTTVLATVVVLVCAACSTGKPPPAAAPQIPTILPPTTFTRAPQMTDRPLPDDCELIVPVPSVHKFLGRELPGELRTIIGIAEPSLARTGKVDCYYGLGERQPLGSAPVVVGLATYGDPESAARRVEESVAAERKDGASVTEKEVGKVKASLVGTKDERLLIGSLGKTTFVTRAKVGVLPDDQIGVFLAALAQQAMTPIEDA